jgi:hypothetical protein
VIWSHKGIRLQALEYYNPEDTYDDAHIRHVRIIKSQVIMCTPEEVINYATFKPGPHGGAAAFDCGKSEWLKSFSQLHLTKSSHYQLMFYDKLYDIIADGLDFRKGRYEDDTTQLGAPPDRPPGGR